MVLDFTFHNEWRDLFQPWFILNLNNVYDKKLKACQLEYALNYIFVQLCFYGDYLTSEKNSKTYIWTYLKCASIYFYHTFIF